MEKNTLTNAIENLEELFMVLNERYFNDELVKPVITISPNTAKVNCYGWCTTYKAWKEKDGGDGYFEINIVAEHLARPFYDVAGTMLHEMVHLYNLEKGVKDTSRAGTYHNKKFKDYAESHGLNVAKDEKYGWCITTLNDEAREEVTNFMDFINEESFSIYREKAPKPEKKVGSKSSSRKYVCPCCGMIIRATKEVKVICAECDVLLEEET